MKVFLLEVGSVTVSQISDRKGYLQCLECKRIILPGKLTEHDDNKCKKHSISIEDAHKNNLLDVQWNLVDIFSSHEDAEEFGKEVAGDGVYLSRITPHKKRSSTYNINLEIEHSDYYTKEKHDVLSIWFDTGVQLCIVYEGAVVKTTLVDMEFSAINGQMTVEESQTLSEQLSILGDFSETIESHIKSNQEMSVENVRKLLEI